MDKQTGLFGIPSSALVVVGLFALACSALALCALVVLAFGLDIGLCAA